MLAASDLVPEGRLFADQMLRDASTIHSASPRRCRPATRARVKETMRRLA